MAITCYFSLPVHPEEPPQPWEDWKEPPSAWKGLCHMLSALALSSFCSIHTVSLSVFAWTVQAALLPFCHLLLSVYL